MKRIALVLLLNFIIFSNLCYADYTTKIHSGVKALQSINPRDLKNCGSTNASVDPTCNMQQLLTTHKSVNSFCDKSKKCCKESGLGQGCQSDSIPEEQKQKNLEWVYANFRNIKAKFSKTCCGTKESCLKKFTTVAIHYDPPELNKEIHSGYYLPTDNSIHINHLALNCKTTNCIENLLRHELGHGCQAAYNNLNTDKKDLFTSIMEKKTTDCMYDAVKKYSDMYLVPHSLASWQDEAFANLVFSKFQKSQEDLAYDCYTASDNEHSDAMTYMHCIPQLNHLTPYSHKETYNDPFLEERIQSLGSRKNRLEPIDFSIREGLKIHESYKVGEKMYFGIGVNAPGQDSQYFITSVRTQVLSDKSKELYIKNSEFSTATSGVGSTHEFTIPPKTKKGIYTVMVTLTLANGKTIQSKKTFKIE